MLDALRLSLGSRVFLISVFILGGSAFGLRWYADSTGTLFRKAAAPLRKPLKHFDRDALHPYRVRRSVLLQPEEEESLGTTQYINWVLEDTSQGESETVLRWARLFVSYYTDSPDQVPHVPEACYLGAGFSPAGGGTESFEMPEMAALGYDTTVPYRALTFTKPADVGERSETVVYTFGVNNVIRADRNGVRQAMSNLTDKYAYFCKVEVAFGLSSQYSDPEREDVIVAARKLFRLILPVLIRDHWPDLKELEANEDKVVREVESAGSG